MKAHYWRMRAYSPYFDTASSWSSKAWAYQSAYAIYPGSAVDVQHPEWILRDAAGNKLYIPFGCSGGKCTQYAADIGNPAFASGGSTSPAPGSPRATPASTFDDVNLYRKVSNGIGVAGRPDRPAHRRRDERADMAALPRRSDAGRPHRVPDDRDRPQRDLVRRRHHGRPAARPPRRHPDQPRARRQRRRPHGRHGQVELAALLAFIDHRQAEGHGVVFDATSTTAAGRLYGLAAYFLISSDRDGLGNNQGGTPTDWWTGYDVDLGAPLAGRYSWNGLSAATSPAATRSSTSPAPPPAPSPSAGSRT